jgi:glutamyl-Q tRNA(Asp) synthetase
MAARDTGSTPPLYIGRFAPSPTGPLHFGSLIAALGSLLQARAQGGLWRVRMEDLDPPRELPGAADAILRTLEAYGLHWDGEVLYQRSRTQAYEQALQRLMGRGLAYGCRCSRRALRSQAKPGPLGEVYPGTCRALGHKIRDSTAIRVIAPQQTIGFEDGLMGPWRQNLARELGDFIIRRRDGLIAYQLAVVVDDAHQGITEVVRGTDLLSSTPRQIHLQQLLGLDTPRYRHLPIAVHPNGDKLSKQTGAAPLPDHDPVPQLVRALRFLNQDPPQALLEASVDELRDWAVAHWKAQALPHRPEITLPSDRGLRSQA